MSFVASLASSPDESGVAARRALAASTAVRMAYLMGTGIDLVPESAEGTLLRAQRRFLRRQAPVALKPAGFDPVVIRDHLLRLGPIGGASDSELTTRLIVTLRLYGAARAADLASWPAGSWSCEPVGTSLVDCEGLVMRFYDSKESRGKAADRKANLWTAVPFVLQPVSAARLVSVGMEPRLAADIQAACCPVSTLQEFMSRHHAKFDQGSRVVLGGRSCLAAGTLLQDRPRSSSGALQFLGAQRINKRLLAFQQSAGVLPEAAQGVGVFKPRHWRHVSASCMRLTSSVEVARSVLRHQSVDTFFRHYEIDIPSSFVDRWSVLPAAKEHLSVVERFLV